MMKMITELTRNAETEMAIVTTVTDTPLGTNVLVTLVSLPLSESISLLVVAKLFIGRQSASYGKGVDHHKL